MIGAAPPVQPPRITVRPQAASRPATTRREWARMLCRLQNGPSNRCHRSMSQIFAINAFKDNYIWVLPNPESGSAFVVDPGDAEPVRAGLAAAGLELGGILVTHHHWDHTNGIKELLADAQVPVVAPVDDRIEGVTHPVRDGDEVRLDGLPVRFQVLEIPGHTSSHI